MIIRFETVRLGLKNLFLHKLRSLLTVLGIIFGVAAVITMVAIGEGSKRRALAEIRGLGADNIIIRSVKPPEPKTTPGSRRQAQLRYGIKRIDLRRIEDTLTGINLTVPLKRIGTKITRGQHRAQGTAFGTTPRLPELASLRIERGRFLSDIDGQRLGRVAVIGAKIADELFPLQDPLGEEVYIDSFTFSVIGILNAPNATDTTASPLIGRDLSYDVYIPIETATKHFGDTAFRRKSGTWEASRVEISDLYLRVDRSVDVITLSEKLALLLDHEHKDTGDVEMIVPVQLLRQVERTQRMFNVLMVSIASISLLIGGIGIMNIMLATVTERTREIGIRRALGATRGHIVAQFLVETAVLSVMGGLLGIAGGFGATALVLAARGWFPAIERPHMTAWSVLVSFTVAVSIGIAFGVYPAVLASRQDPITALRHD